MIRRWQGDSVRVHVDDQVFTWQTYGGISRYFYELMRAYRTDSSLGVELVTPRIWTRTHSLYECEMGRRVPALLGKRRRLIRWMNRRLQAEKPCDVIHHTYYDPRYLRQFRQSSLRVITIVDMIPERFPELFPGGNPHRGKREYVEAADLIICISEATKRDLLDFYGEPRAPITVTPLGVSTDFHSGAVRAASCPDHYFLFVGARPGYKDFSVLAEAFAEAELPREIKLMLVGGGRLRSQEKSLLKRLAIRDRVVLASLSDVELAGAYANALALVFPSRCEGFGVPTLEAMATGCPVILASASAHVEVGGDAALFFFPGDVAELAGRLTEVVSNEELRKKLIRVGKRRAAQFSWNETARLTAAAYREWT
ncbi:MAG TPA: glycosyltransferase family 1 protein [Porticoccaceae bacterium]|nr:glycosyltransferase family 1 protein [Porticoccaceae bacterium]